ncbi:aminodeoxychorismate lyase [Oceanobacter sp. 5_MG-2023]|uniref:aminodeoxychorismate lyase n=1 Tax=Oceanobacter sp. 5_MG-2023 TaxID=3062645 RepID=UPI0026E3C634|nr:aminodeoxychorismate lyase [Oceanobacter sp. 5_MG-2023]MDO6681046.1 aminodeoxychorismate lyase [Oceanobacter sp. 5_MG-2023]
MTRVLCRLAGQWQDDWPATDRGLHYGDGLFETMRLSAGRIPLWPLHQARLQAGITALRFPSATMDDVLQALATLPEPQRLDRYSAVKLLLSRGTGPRGYAIPEPTAINLQLHLFDAPQWRWSGLSAECPGLTIGVNPVRLGRQPRLAGLKHLNRLEQVLARAEFQPGWDESLMLDDQEQVIEGCYSNLIIRRGGQWLTPSLATSGVNGVVRQWLLQQLDVTVTGLSLDDIKQADALFMSNSLMGIVPVARMDTTSYAPTSEALDVMRVLQTRLESLF